MELNDYLNLPYTITLRRDDDADWVARIEELKGCTAHGSTEAEALADLNTAKREWIQAALEDKIEIPKPEPEEQLPSGKWIQRVPRRLHRELRRLARLEGTSLNHLVSNILANYVGEMTARRAATQGQAFVLLVGQGYSASVAPTYTVTRVSGNLRTANLPALSGLIAIEGSRG